MSDLVKRLLLDSEGVCPIHINYYRKDFFEAAAEITRLTEEVEKLREAFDTLIGTADTYGENDIADIGRELLASIDKAKGTTDDAE
jgi:DNA-binding ferritin-like protein